MTPARPYHHRDATHGCCFACGAQTWPRGDVCPGGASSRQRLINAQTLLAEVAACRSPAGTIVPFGLMERIAEALGEER